MNDSRATRVRPIRGSATAVAKAIRHLFVEGDSMLRAVQLLGGCRFGEPHGSPLDRTGVRIIERMFFLSRGPSEWP